MKKDQRMTKNGVKNSGPALLGRVWFPKSKFQFFFRHLHGDLNLDEIKNALRLRSVNGETNIMNLIRL